MTWLKSNLSTIVITLVLIVIVGLIIPQHGSGQEEWKVLLRRELRRLQRLLSLPSHQEVTSQGDSGNAPESPFALWNNKKRRSKQWTIRP